MKKHIQLSGFGINLKSTITKYFYRKALSLGEKVLPVYSDSELIADMYSRYWATFDPEERCRFRYHQIFSCISDFGEDFSLIIDRGIIDQICFARLIDIGVIPHTNWLEEGFGELNDNYKFIDDYIPYELKLNLCRIFIYNKNIKLVESVLSNERDNGIDKRSYFSKTVDDYFYLQNQFLLQYGSIIDSYYLLTIPDVPLSDIPNIITNLTEEIERIWKGVAL